MRPFFGGLWDCLIGRWWKNSRSNSTTDRNPMDEDFVTVRDSRSPPPPLLPPTDVLSTALVACAIERRPSDPALHPIPAPSPATLLRLPTPRAPLRKRDRRLNALILHGFKLLQERHEVIVQGIVDAPTKMTVWHLPLSISQSRIGGRFTPSNACTIISLKMAEAAYRCPIFVLPPSMDDVCYGSGGIFSTPSSKAFLDRKRSSEEHAAEAAARAFHVLCPSQLIATLTNGIVDGNDIYEKEMTRRRKSVLPQPKRETLTIPEAMEALNRFGLRCKRFLPVIPPLTAIMHEVDFVTNRGLIWVDLPLQMDAAIEHPALSTWSILAFIIICCEKAVVMLYRRDIDSICLLDSHAHYTLTHSNQGAIVATVPRVSVRPLVRWMYNVVFPDLRNKPDPKFEISLVQYTARPSVEVDELEPACSRAPVNLKVFRRPQHRAPGYQPKPPISSAVQTTALVGSSGYDSGYDTCGEDKGEEEEAKE